MLVRNYVYFTLAVAIVLLALFTIFTIITDKAFIEAKIEKLPNQIEKIESEHYDKVDAQRLFGRSGYFEILDEEGKIIYKSKDSKKSAYSNGELECISDFDRGWNLILTKYGSKPTETKYLLQYFKENEEENEEENDNIGFLILDSEYQVIYNDMNTDRTSFTKNEIKLLEMKKYQVKKMEFMSVEGKKHTMVMYIHYLDYKSWEKSTRLMLWIIPIFMICYVVMILVFVFILNKKVKIPLLMLNVAMLDFAEKKMEGEIDYNGPDEFVQICETFNKMSGLLLESEKENKKLAQDKQKMLADISHDLKTPITVIKGYAKAINDGIVNENKREHYIKIIYEKADALTEMINTFYEYNKLEHPDFQLILQKKDICEEIRGYLAIKYEEIERSGFFLEVDLPEKRIEIDIDTSQMQRVYDNIVGNVLRHNKKGTTVFLRLREIGMQLVISIADDGVGIPKEMEESVFEAFIVGDESRNKKQGSGLGLGIARQIVLAHGGTICLKVPPENNYSTQFEIILIKKL
ncbi:MAG: sensor histidine kinase [Velocimicrobium sp.]